MRSARVEGAASLTWGLPSFRTPAYIRQAVERELEADPDIGKYALPDGLPELRRLVAAERSAIGPEVDAEENVLITAEHTTSQDFAIRLLEEAGVTVTPGAAFGPSGEHHVRMAYCVEEETIERAFDRIEAHFPR